jgi:ABC-type amino acid transport substrate-binding protein
MRFAIVLTALLAATGCGQFPRDAQDTLKEAKQGVPLTVGWSVAEPWVRRGGPDGPAGIEPDLLRAWAAAERVRLEWVEGSEGQLAEALAQNRADLATAGLTKKTPHAASIGMTQPYLSVPIVIGAAAGVNVPEDWEGVQVRYDRRRPEFAAAIAGVKALPVPAEPGALRPFAAVYRPELQALGLTDTETALLTEKRVIATAPAENALTLSLDKFLHARKPDIEARLGAEARR